MKTPERILDLIRVGVYTQMEGNLERFRGEYRFRFATNQIEDMPELISRVTGNPINKSLLISVNSKNLFKDLNSMGFEIFTAKDWNVPTLSGYSQNSCNEYLRAVIDSIGNVDVEKQVPVVRLTSVNIGGLGQIASFFDAKSVWSPGQNRYRAYWKGRNAIKILDSVGWKFYNRRNQRGAELIKSVRWEEYLI